VIDGERSWRKTRDGRIEPVPEQLLADDLKWYAGHVYRTIHRVARRDPAIELGEGTDGRLEVYELCLRGARGRHRQRLRSVGASRGRHPSPTLGIQLRRYLAGHGRVTGGQCPHGRWTVRALWRSHTVMGSTGPAPTS
jgi:hypothetical protein